MKRILTEAPTKLYWHHEPTIEQEFEAQILRCASLLFPSYYSGIWKPIIRDGKRRGARPDMVLISKEYEMWYVVEVELAHHSIRNHVIPQLETLSQGIYDRSLVPSLATAVPEVSESSLYSLVYRLPGLLCIANGYTEDLHAACRDYNFELAVLEPYQGENGGWALHATKVSSAMQSVTQVGKYQLRRGSVVGDREYLELPQHFPLWHGNITVTSDGLGCECKLHSDGARRFVLIPSEKLPSNRPVSLVMLDSDRRHLRLEVE